MGGDCRCRLFGSFDKASEEPHFVRRRALATFRVSAFRAVDFVLAAGGWAMLFYVGASLLNNWDALDKHHLVRQFAMPIWLTIGALPFIYFLGLWAAYEKAFIRVNWRSEAGWWGRTRAK